jgi:methionyl-tRNA synthetase
MTPERRQQLLGQTSLGQQVLNKQARANAVNFGEMPPALAKALAEKKEGGDKSADGECDSCGAKGAKGEKCEDCGKGTYA